MGAKTCEPFKCSCGATVDSSGSHGLSCNKNPIGRISRHESINHVISRSLASLQIQSILEHHGTMRDQRRPDGVTIVPWDRGRSLAWDVTVVDTLAASYLNSSSSSCGSAVAEAERKKINKYRDLGPLYLFYPVAFETMGVAGELTRKLINDIGRRLERELGEKRATEFLWQRISLEVQKGNAAAVAGTFPRTSPVADFLNF